MATRGSFVHNSMVEFRGHPKNVSFMQFSQRVDGFRQKDSQGLLELVQLYRTKPIRETFNFHHLPKLYIGFKPWKKGCENIPVTRFTILIYPIA